MSSQCGPHQEIRLLSVFARRPKVTRPGDDRIIMKLNAELFDVARRSHEFGIPVLAAVPVVASIEDVTLGAPCQWYRLSPDSLDVRDLEVTLASDGSSKGAVIPDVVTGPMNADAIVGIVHKATRSVSWDEGVESLRTIRTRTKAERGTFPYFGGYKPFNIMVMDR